MRHSGTNASEPGSPTGGIPGPEETKIRNLILEGDIKQLQQITGLDLGFNIITQRKIAVLFRTALRLGKNRDEFRDVLSLGEVQIATRRGL